MTQRIALLSVYDKTGVVELAQGLVELGWGIVSSGGTSKELKQTEVPHRQVEEVTDFPEMMDGRIKTLHPKIAGGILADRNKSGHMADLMTHEIEAIDLVVCNLYPFAATVASGANWQDCIEKIDVGGPTMVRAAAKNHDSVAVLVDPADYDSLLEELRQNDGVLTTVTRRRLAHKAFAQTAAYDADITAWLDQQSGVKPSPPR